MNIVSMLKATQKLVIDNSPGILAGLGVAGAVTSAALTGRAAFRVGMDASTQYHEEYQATGHLDAELLSTKHLTKTYWKEFIPGAAVLAGTVICIVGATTVSSRRTAAITAAFKISEELADGYKKKVVETLGSQKEEKMRSDLAAERIEKIGGSETFIITGSEVLFHDSFSGRVFVSEKTKVDAAVNKINYQVNNFNYASLTDFYNELGLDKIQFSDDLGWNGDEHLDIKFTGVIIHDKPAISMEFRTSPIRGYDRCM